MGIDEAVDVTGRRATEAVLDLTGGEGADLVIEAVGSVDTLNQSLQIARALGRVAVFGLPPHHGEGALRLGHLLPARGWTCTPSSALRTSPDSRRSGWRVDYIASGQIDMAPFVTHQLPITQVQDAFDLAYSKEDGALKVSLTF